MVNRRLVHRPSYCATFSTCRVLQHFGETGRKHEHAEDFELRHVSVSKGGTEVRTGRIPTAVTGRAGRRRVQVGRKIRNVTAKFCDSYEPAMGCRFFFCPDKSPLVPT